MSLEGWIFMVGLRVVDVGGLIVWMVWFFRLRDDDEDERDDDSGGNQPRVPDPRDDGPRDGLPVPLPDADPWPTRRRGHEDRGPLRGPGRRRAPAPAPPPVPARGPATGAS